MQRTQSLLLSRPSQEADLRAVYQAICEDAAENVEANFVSLWRFDDELTKITCRHAFDAITGETSSGQELFREDFPTYFDVIVQENTVCAPDARTDRITQELSEPYFVPNDVVSLLDFVVHHDFRPVGVICCESKRVRREWSEQDRRYLLKLATLASFQTRI